MQPPPEIVWPEAFPRLETPRLVLRQFRTDDLDGLFRCLSNPGTVRFVMDPVDEPETLRGVLDEYIQGHGEGDSLNWALEEKASGAYAGSVSLQEFSFHDRFSEAAFDLDSMFQGKGLMTEALGAVLDLAFGGMQLHRVEARVVAGNTRSEKLLERLGFRSEGTLRQSFLLQGILRDVRIFGRLSSDRI